MASFEHLDALRRRNLELLATLKHRTEQLQSLRLSRPSKEAESKATGSVLLSSKRLSLGNSKQKNRPPLTERNEAPSNKMGTVAAGVNSPHVARKARCNANIRITNITEPEDTTCDRLLQDQGNKRLYRQFDATAHVHSNPRVFTQGKDRVGMYQVTAFDQELNNTLETERRHVQPLLGYDWIAGLLDAETSLTERSEQFFSDLRNFRQDNKDECVSNQSSGLPAEVDPWTSLGDAIEEEPYPEPHQCLYRYRINSRLFAVSLDSQAACLVCKMPKAIHPHTEKEPAFIRVSIPRSALLPAYQYKAHRRNSFDSSDSLGLPYHCLSGWSNITPKAGSRMTSLDLRSSVKLVPNAHAAPFAWPGNQLKSSASMVLGSQHSNQLLNVSRLARYQFQHLGTARAKPNESSYPIY